MRRWRAAALASLGFFLLSGCSDRVAGGGTEETNGSLAGVVLDSGGAPVAGALIYIRPADFLRDTSLVGDGEEGLTSTTDGAGRFLKTALPPGSYAVEIRKAGQMAELQRTTVSIGARTHLSSAVLGAGGELSGDLVPVPGVAPGFVQVYGLDRVARADSAGHFVLGNLPPGAIQTRFVAAESAFAYPDRKTFTIAAADTTRTGPIDFTEPYPNWAHSRPIRLNTVAAGLTDTLRGYPTFIRLDASVFDFSSSTGVDLRFLSASGHRLQHQVEEWDAAQGKAAIWVRVDTLFGNRSDQSITMYWGNPTARNFSSGPAVFPGSTGVWHLDSPNCAPGSAVADSGCVYPESTPNLVAGRGNAVPQSGNGGLGRYARFTNQRIVAYGKPNMYLEKAVSMSAWVRSDSAFKGDGVIATFGGNYGMRLFGSGDLRFYVFTDSTWTGPGVPAETSWTSCDTKGLKLRDNAWHHLAVVWDGSIARLYVDGIEREAIPFPVKPVDRPIQEVSIGKNIIASDDRDYDGDLDEIRFAPSAWVPRRILADYQTQRADAKLVEFK